MLQAIETKYLGPTNFRGSRIKAWCQAGSLTLGSEHWENKNASDEAHVVVATALAKKLGWLEFSDLRGGHTIKGCVFVLVKKDGSPR